MIADRKTQAALALHRFGLGPRQGSIAAIAADPQGALLAELDRPGAGLIANPALRTSSEAARAAFEFRAARKAAKAGAAASAPAAEPSGGAPANQPAQGTDMAAAPSPANPKANLGPAIPQQIYREEARSRIEAALGADIDATRRLVQRSTAGT